MEKEEQEIIDAQNRDEKALVKDKSMWMSMVASVVAFLLSTAVSFFLTPYLIKTVGEDEYSFYPLANSFVSYISIITVALNSMAGRFVTISLHRKETKKAKEYFNAVFFSSIIFCVILIPIGSLFIYNIDSFLTVPAELLTNVKILFGLVLICMVINQMTNILSIATYYKDKLYLNSFASVVSYVVQVLVALLLFGLFPAKVYYVGIMNICVYLTVAIFYLFYTRRLMPEMRIDRKYFRADRVKELLSSGVWNSVSQLSNVLLNGLDLLIANTYLGTMATAIISVSKTLPNNMTSLVSVISNIFQPRFAREYAYNNTNALSESVKSSIRLLGAIFCMPLGFLIVNGKSFFELWVPQMDAQKLQVLSIMGMGILFLSASITPVYGIFTITNKVKTNSIVVLATGVLNVAVVLTLVQFTSDEIVRMYIIVGTSTAIGIIRHLLFTIPYASKCMKIKWYSLYMPLLRNVMLLGISGAVYFTVARFVPQETWLGFLFCGFIGTVIIALILWLVFLKKQERDALIGFLKEKIGRRR